VHIKELKSLIFVHYPRLRDEKVREILLTIPQFHYPDVANGNVHLSLNLLGYKPLAKDKSTT